jgi:hypothetical protein
MLRGQRILVLCAVAGLMLTVAIALVYDYYNILSNDEITYINAMRGVSVERHIGFWLPASLAYKIAGTMGVRLYNILLYVLGILMLLYHSRMVHDFRVRLLVVYLFAFNPLIIYFVPRILSEASAYSLTLLSLILAGKSSFLSGIAWGLGFTAKYYLVITLPFVLSVVYRTEHSTRRMLLFIVGAIIPIILMLVYSYIITGNALYVVLRAGPEIYKPLSERHFIARSLILSSASILLVSFPFIRDVLSSLVTAWREDRALTYGFILMALANAILGFLHLTGMETTWRYRDHIRLASIAASTFPIMIVLHPPEIVTKRYLTTVIILSIIAVLLLLLLRLRVYHIITF